MEDKLFVYFLSRFKYDEKESTEYNYHFGKNYSVEKFNIEFNKFIYMLDSFYYHETKYVTAINSYNIVLPKRVLRQVIKLFSYSSDNKIIPQKYLLEDFLLTYYKTIYNNRKENNDYIKVVNDFKKIMSNLGMKYFYNQFINECTLFYYQVIKYAISNNLYISPEVIEKIINNVKSTNDKNKIIEELIKNSKYCHFLYKYDSKIEEHKSIYFDYCKKSISQKYNVNDSNSIINYLISKNILDAREKTIIVNIYVQKTNDLCNLYKSKKESFINFLSQIDSLKNNIYNLTDNNNLEVDYKNKLHECLINLLNLKRYILSDHDYVNSEMHEFSEKVTIKQELVDEFINELEKDVYKICNASIPNFDNSMISSIKNYSEFPMLSIVSRYDINNSTQTYLTNSNYIVSYKYSFEKYYDNVGKKYTEKNHEKLLNIKTKDYYNELIKNLSRTFMMHQNIIITTLGEEKFNNIINEIKMKLKYTYQNDYEIIVANILAIEVNIFKILNNNNICFGKDMVENLDLLFSKYEKNKFARNGIMYIYYSLYNHTGPNLRNKAMHGELINEDLKIPLLISFSGLIFISWLLNEKK